MLILAQQQKLARQKSMLKYFDDFVEEGAGDNLLGNNLLGNNLLGNNLLGNNSPAHIDSNTNMDTKAKSNPNEDMTGNNFLEKNSEINIKNLFQKI